MQSITKLLKEPSVKPDSKGGKGPQKRSWEACRRVPRSRGRTEPLSQAMPGPRLEQGTGVYSVRQTWRTGQDRLVQIVLCDTEVIHLM